MRYAPVHSSHVIHVFSLLICPSSVSTPLKMCKKHLVEPRQIFLIFSQVKNKGHTGIQFITTKWLTWDSAILAFEFWDKECVQIVSEKMLPGVNFPLVSDKPYEFYVLLETQGSHKEHDEEVRLNFMVWIEYKQNLDVLTQGKWLEIGELSRNFAGG